MLCCAQATACLSFLAMTPSLSFPAVPLPRPPRPTSHPPLLPLFPLLVLPLLLLLVLTPIALQHCHSLRSQIQTHGTQSSSHMLKFTATTSTISLTDAQCGKQTVGHTTRESGRREDTHTHARTHKQRHARKTKLSSNGRSCWVLEEANQHWLW